MENIWKGRRIRYKGWKLFTCNAFTYCLFISLYVYSIDMHESPNYTLPLTHIDWNTVESCVNIRTCHPWWNIARIFLRKNFYYDFCLLRSFLFFCVSSFVLFLISFLSFSFSVIHPFLLSFFHKFLASLFICHPCQYSLHLSIITHEERSVLHFWWWQPKPRCMLVSRLLPMVPVAIKSINGSQLATLSP